MKFEAWVVADREEVQVPLQGPEFRGNLIMLHSLTECQVAGVFKTRAEAEKELVRARREWPKAAIWRYEQEASCRLGGVDDETT